LGLFEQAEHLVSDASEKQHLKTCILQAREHLRQLHNPSESTPNTSNRGPKMSPFFFFFFFFFCISQLIQFLLFTFQNRHFKSKFHLVLLCVDSGYLFEGHLTVDPEPPQPHWLVHSNLLTTAATLFAAESSQGPAESNNTTENAASLLQDLITSLDDVLPLVLL
jgi:E3 ubiquitin-protein ligase AIP2